MMDVALINTNRIKPPIAPIGLDYVAEALYVAGHRGLVGSALVRAGLAACRRPVEKIVPYVKAPEEALPGVPRHYATTMPFGLDAHGLVVESHEGRPTKIEGNPRHPSSAGASSALIQASILDLYDPDRSQRFLRNGNNVDAAAAQDFLTETGNQFVEKEGEGLAFLVEPGSAPSRDRLLASIQSRMDR